MTQTTLTDYKYTEVPKQLSYEIFPLTITFKSYQSLKYIDDAVYISSEVLQLGYIERGQKDNNIEVRGRGRLLESLTDREIMPTCQMPIINESCFINLMGSRRSAIQNFQCCCYDHWFVL